VDRCNAADNRRPNPNGFRLEARGPFRYRNRWNWIANLRTKLPPVVRELHTEIIAPAAFDIPRQLHRVRLAVCRTLLRRGHVEVYSWTDVDGKQPNFFRFRQLQTE